MNENLLNSRMADGVGRVGFRKWYERELLSSHAHMILCVLAVVAMIASFEAMRTGSVPERVMNLIFVLACAAIGLWALRRYLFLLMRAEELANQANCPECGTYGRFKVVADDRHARETQVSCTKCQHNWTITST